MKEITREFAEKTFALFGSKDIESVMACFAEDALLYDPHYPVSTMKGKKAIRQGFEWAFGSMEKPGFGIRHFWSDGECAAVELDTHHVFKGGMELKFPQVFIMEAKDGLITRLQSYVPYAPPGIGGFLAKVTRLVWKMQGKL
jgi:ketosteroid isomerase-like protein